MTAARWPLGWITLGAAALALLAAWLMKDPVWAGVVTRGAIMALAAMGLQLILGGAGMVSFGHAAPFGAGAYAALLAGIWGFHEIWIVLPFAGLCGAAFCAVTGLASLRARGTYFIMITLAFAQMLYFVGASVSAFGGDDGMALPARMTLFGAKIVRTDYALGALALAMAAAALMFLERMSRAPFGVVLAGLRENEARMAALGLTPFMHRMAAYAASGAMAGLAGALLANQSEYVAPAYISWHRSGEFIVMVALGGAMRPGGAALGAFAFVLFEELAGHQTEYWKIGLGAFLVAAVLMRGGKGGGHG